MQFHKTALNLIVVDFESVAKDILTSNISWLKDWGLFEDDLDPKERHRLLLFHTLAAIHTVYAVHSDRKNVIFYVNETVNIDRQILECLNTLTQYFPILVYKDRIPFTCLDSACGEAVELLGGLGHYRYDFKFEQFSSRDSADFFSKFHIQPEAISK